MVRFSFISVLTVIIACFFTGCSSGPRYYSEGYTQNGGASWYGEDFDGKLTADGERFNMHDLTAAHRRLPFGSIVRVTNQLNGRSVEVRINDRGPFEGGRIIDVSSAAADILQMKGAGVVPVQIEVLHVGPQRHHDDG